MGRTPELKEIKKEDVSIDDNKSKIKTLNNLPITEIEEPLFSVPKDKNKKNLCIIMKENTGCVFKWVNKKAYRFNLDEHAYFNYRSQAYITDNRIAVNIYFEGIPVPMHHSYIKTKKDTKIITTLDGKEETIEFQKISGVDVDSQVIYYLLDRGLADEFTEKTKVGIGSAVGIILIIITLILTVIELFQV